jgi:FMN phosphatase YigB (HAD superfamily)
MKRTILADGMHTIYDRNFNINKELLEIIDFFDTKKILVVNGFREKGKEVLKNSSITEAFSLEEKQIKKENPEFFEVLLSRFDLKPKDLIYFDHDENNVKSAESVGIISRHYTNNNEEIKDFIGENLEI